MYWLALILVATGGATGHSFGSIGLLTIPSANQSVGIVVLVRTPSTHSFKQSLDR